jgi:hypothetical protein
VFGDRLGAHHFSPALPLVYCFAAAVYDRVASVAMRGGRPLAGRTAVAAAGLVFMAVIAGNAVNMQTVLERLRASGGVGYFSDAVNRFAHAARADAEALYVFPGWGLFMPFAMITRGEVEFTLSIDRAELGRRICAGRDVVVAAIGPDARRELDETTRPLGGFPFERANYAQRNGVPVIFIARFSGKAVPFDPVCKP